MTAGADVTIVGSDRVKGAQAERVLNNDPGRVGRATFIAADLSSMHQVHQLADAMTEHLDVLMSSSTMLGSSRPIGSRRSTARADLRGQLLGAVRADQRLARLLSSSQPARVLSLTAAVEPIGRLPFDDLQRERHFGGLRAYAQSKKALAMFTLELARRQHADGGGVTANVIDPFLVRTGLTGAKDAPVLFKLARPLMIRPETAARWVARAATDERLAGTTGRHFMLGHRAPTPLGTRSRRRATRLWDASVELTASSLLTTNR